MRNEKWLVVQTQSGYDSLSYKLKKSTIMSSWLWLVHSLRAIYSFMDVPIILQIWVILIILLQLGCFVIFEMEIVLCPISILIVHMVIYYGSILQIEYGVLYMWTLDVGVDGSKRDGSRMGGLPMLLGAKVSLISIFFWWSLLLYYLHGDCPHQCSTIYTNYIDYNHGLFFCHRLLILHLFVHQITDNCKSTKLVHGESPTYESMKVYQTFYLI